MTIPDASFTTISYGFGQQNMARRMLANSNNSLTRAAIFRVLQKDRSSTPLC